MMNDDLVWQQNSSQSNNQENLAAIAQWWSSLADKKVVWQQAINSLKR